MSIIPSSLADLTSIQKEEMIASLATLLVGSGSEEEITSEKLQAVATAAGCDLSSPIATLFASTVSSVEAYKMGPGGGGGGGGGDGGGGGGGDAAAAVEEVVEEEEEAPPAADDMFGGGDGGDY